MKNLDINRFITFLEIYRDKCLESNEKLIKFLNIENPMYWRRYGISREGKIGESDEYKYIFHGTDCIFYSENYKVEFEFGFDGRVGGFSLWKLFCFAEDGPAGFECFQNEKLLKQYLKEAEMNGYINRPYLACHDDMFYLNEKKINMDMHRLSL